MRARHRRDPTLSHSIWSRMTAVGVLLSLTPGCALRRWESVPTAPELARRLDLERERVRIPTASGPIRMRVVRFAYPQVEGVPEPGSGAVAFPVRGATAEVRTRVPSGWAFAPVELRDRASLVGLLDQDVEFTAADGKRLALHVRLVGDRAVLGEPIPCWSDRHGRCTATVLVDLQRVARIEVEEPSWGGIAGGVVLAGLLSFVVWAVIFVEAGEFL